jgi:cephalosporin hydroxylase
MYDEQGLLIYSLVKYIKPEVVIQTGHLWGKSACFILEALSDEILNAFVFEKSQESDKDYTGFVDRHRPTKQTAAKFISIDPFRSPERHTPPRWKEGVELLKEKYGDGFEFYHQTSDAFFNENREKYKGKHLLAVVDGDHSPAGLRRDLDNLDEMECKYIVVDDVLFLPHLGRVCEEFADQKGFAYAPINLYNGLGLLTKK